MKKFFVHFLASAGFFILLGAGCQKNPATDPSATQIAKITRDQQVYVYCTNRGFEARIQFDSEVNRNRIFCSFPTGRKCDAYDFVDGKCNPKEPNPDDINSSLTPIVGTRMECDHIANPVCTTDGKTYTNRCTAETQGKKVKYEGSCNEKDAPFELDVPPYDPQSSKSRVPSPTYATPLHSSDEKTNTLPSNQAPKKSESPSAAPPSPQPHVSATSGSTASTEWLPNLESVLQSSTSPYKLSISECAVGSEKYYYQKEECVNCYQVLYTENGDTACYPGLADGQCPAWSETKCKIIWQK